MSREVTPEIVAWVRAQSPDWQDSDSAIAAALNAVTVDNPEPAPLVLPVLSAMVLFQRVGAESRARLGNYACPAKATVLLNYCDLHLDLISDTTPEKQGRYLPGLGTPIVPPSDLRDYDPDRVLLLAPNFTDEILVKEPGLTGRWVLPFPALTRA